MATSQSAVDTCPSCRAVAAALGEGRYRCERCGIDFTLADAVAPPAAAPPAAPPAAPDRALELTRERLELELEELQSEVSSTQTQGGMRIAYWIIAAVLGFVVSRMIASIIPALGTLVFVEQLERLDVRIAQAGR